MKGYQEGKRKSWFILRKYTKIAIKPALIDFNFSRSTLKHRNSSLKVEVHLKWLFTHPFVPLQELPHIVSQRVWLKSPCLQWKNHTNHQGLYFYFSRICCILQLILSYPYRRAYIQIQPRDNPRLYLFFIRNLENFQYSLTFHVSFIIFLAEPSLRLRFQ